MNSNPAGPTGHSTTTHSTRTVGNKMAGAKSKITTTSLRTIKPPPPPAPTLAPTIPPPAHTSLTRLEEKKLMKSLGLCSSLKKRVPGPIESIPFSERLNVPQRTKTHKVAAAIRKPRGSLPHDSMPNWSLLAPDQKLPYISAPAPPDDSNDVPLLYSHAVAGEPLIRRTGPYHLDDPHNYEMGITFPYNPLHDPCLHEYFESPEVRKLLAEHGLITEDGNFVIENVHEMNRYRQYLYRTVYSDKLKEALADHDLTNAHFLKQLDKINKFIDKTEGKAAIAQARMDRIQKLKLDDAVRKVKLATEAQLADQHRLLLINVKREEERRQRRVQNYEKRLEREKRVHEMQRKNAAARTDLKQKIATTDLEVARRKKVEREAKEEALKLQRAEAFAAKCEAQKERVAEIRRLEKIISDEREHRAIQRQHDVEKRRVALPDLIAKRKVREKRRLELARKYFDLWREYVHDRKHAEFDEAHTSMWNVEEDIDEMLEFLQQKTGYKKLDNMVMNILEMKRRLQDHIAAQEAEEYGGEGEGEDEDEEEGAGQDAQSETQSIASVAAEPQPQRQIPLESVPLPPVPAYQNTWATPSLGGRIPTKEKMTKK